MREPAPRYAIELPVRLTLTDSYEAFGGISLNISATGALIRTERLEEPRTIINLAFPTFSGVGEVVWSDEPEGQVGVLLGMEFVSFSPEAEDSLAHMLGTFPVPANEA